MGSDATAQQVREVQVADDQEGQRIDNFLAGRLKGVPRSRIYRILRKGEVRVNKGRVKPDYRLRAGDRVRIPPVRQASREAAKPPEQAVARLAGRVLYEDKHLLVLDKPSGMAVHGGSGLSYGVIEALRKARPNAPFLELVHRLDRETSGCLVVAKKRSALRALHTALREGDVDKRYLALVKGVWQGGERRVAAPLRKNTMRSGERLVQVRDDGREALSWFRPVARYRGATLMEVRIGTGRTHQIRVHAAHAGHPLAGDDKYGDKGFNRQMARLGLRRLFLHAGSLGFDHPAETRRVEVQAPLDTALRELLDRLESGNGE